MNIARDRNRQDYKERLDEKQHLHIVVERLRHRRSLYLNAGCTADVSPVSYHRLDNNRQRNRRNREEDALHAQGQKAQREPHEGADGGCSCDLHGERRAKGLDQKYGSVDAHAEERAGTEIHVPRIAPEDAPCDGEYDELQDHVAGKEGILVADDLRHQQGGGEKQGRSKPEENIVTLHDRLPNRPCGRTARTPSSIANEMAGAQEAPNMVRTMVSATPRMMAATSVPVMLPRPAMTTTQNVRPI